MTKLTNQVSECQKIKSLKGNPEKGLVVKEPEVMYTVILLINYLET